MTRLEKLKAINERIGSKLTFDTPEMVSVMLIANILYNLSKRGLIESPWKVSPMGKDVIAVCEEFEWEITDAEIQSFCVDMVPPEQIDAVIYFIKASIDETKSKING